MKVKFLTNGWTGGRRHTADEMRIVSREEGALLIEEGVAVALVRAPEESVADDAATAENAEGAETLPPSDETNPPSDETQAGEVGKKPKRGRTKN